MKATLTTESVQNYIDLHRKLKIPFTLSVSNYTIRLTSLCYDIHFLKTIQSKRAFAAFAKIRSEVIKKPIGKIEANELTYFNVKPRYENLYADLVYNIDIKAAYASVLYTDGFISRKTYNYILTIPKQDRLVSVGMLAGKKNIYKHSKDGKILHSETIISPTSDYFFHCVKRVSDIMNDAAYIMGDEFIFSWVDGIYFLTHPDNKKHIPEKCRIMNNFFKERGFRVTTEKLTSFEMICKKSYYYCRYYKEGKLKFINVPKPDNTTVKKITSYLLKKDYL